MEDTVATFVPLLISTEGDHVCETGALRHESVEVPSAIVQRVGVEQAMLISEGSII